MATLTHRQTLVRAKTHVGTTGSLGLAFQAAAAQALATASFAVSQSNKGSKSHAFLPGMRKSLCGGATRQSGVGGDGKGCPTCGNCSRLVSAVKS